MGLIQIKAKSVPERALFRNGKGGGGIAGAELTANGDVIIVIAAEDLQANKLVHLTETGAFLASNNSVDAIADGMTLQDAITGEYIRIALSGVQNFINTFGAGSILYLGANGAIINNADMASSWWQIIGKAIDESNILIEIETAEKIILT